MFRLMLEYARLVSDDRDAMSYGGIWVGDGKPPPMQEEDYDDLK